MVRDKRDGIGAAGGACGRRLRRVCDCEAGEQASERYCARLGDAPTYTKTRARPRADDGAQQYARARRVLTPESVVSLARPFREGVARGGARSSPALAAPNVCAPLSTHALMAKKGSKGHQERSNDPHPSPAFEWLARSARRSSNLVKWQPAAAHRAGLPLSSAVQVALSRVRGRSPLGFLRWRL